MDETTCLGFFKILQKIPQKYKCNKTGKTLVIAKAGLMDVWQCIILFFLLACILENFNSKKVLKVVLHLP